VFKKVGFLKSRIWPGFDQSQGSGTILGLAVAIVVLSGLLASNLAVFALISAEKLRVQADQIAVAAADSARGLITGFPCQTADQIASMYMVSLDSCRIVGFDSFIRLRSVVAGIELFASSRAGPAEGN
jgi:secretion/DNA translocation related TadE-like protein